MLLSNSISTRHMTFSQSKVSMCRPARSLLLFARIHLKLNKKFKGMDIWGEYSLHLIHPTFFIYLFISKARRAGRGEARRAERDNNKKREIYIALEVLNENDHSPVIEVKKSKGNSWCWSPFHK